MGKAWVRILLVDDRDVGADAVSVGEGDDRRRIIASGSNSEVR